MQTKKKKKRYTRLAGSVFITISTECHLWLAIVSNKGLFNIDWHYWVKKIIFLNALCSFEISVVASINEMEIKRV